jgi:para-nitrobenzyl esterase
MRAEDWSAKPPTFVCDAGTVVGWRDGDLLRATGIRYARADRFTAPVPESPAKEPIMATTWAPACPQSSEPITEQAWGAGHLGTLDYDEHCQRLSVTTPADTTPGEALPVMVWIHGGAYIIGAGDAPIHDPAQLVREHRVIVVTVTFRLGLLGFLGSTGGRPANLGLLDLIEALRWIQCNIKAFGGGPQNVTLFGQSAGGDAIAHLMIADGARGLFRRAIIQSAPLGIANGRAAMNEFMARTADALDSHATTQEVIGTQRRMLIAINGQVARHGFKAAMPFGTQYGFPPLPAETERTAAWRDAAPHVEVLIGNTSREVALFLPGIPELAALLRTPVLGRISHRMFVTSGTSKIYAKAATAFAQRHRAAGGKAYRYLLTFGASGSTYAGAHSIDLPLLFPTWSGWKEASLIAAESKAQLDSHGRQLRAIWAGFARSGHVDVGTIDGLITTTQE